jgi:hypothetical protein
MKFINSRVSAVVAGASVISLLAVGGSVAADQIGSGGIRDDSIRSVDIHNGTIQNVDINPPLLERLSKPGPQGETGPRGETGPQGPKGDSGSNLLYVEDGTEEMSILDVPVPAVALKDFTVPTFFQHRLHGAGDYGPNVILVLDKNDNGQSDADIEAWHVGEDQSDQGKQAALGGDTFAEMDGFGPDVFAVDPNSSTQWWSPGIDYYGPLAGLKSGALGDYTVVGYQIVLGGSGSWMDTGVQVFTSAL